MFRYLISIFFTVLTGLSYGQNYNGANSVQLRILTDKKEYEFISKKMEGRFNDALLRFEFIIPMNSFRSQNDSSDLKFLGTLADWNNNIVINAALPDDRDSDLNLAYFKGNKSINLAGEVKVGNFTFEDDIAFNGMLMGDNKTMAFDFKLFLGEHALSQEAKINGERIIEIELSALGDKIIGLTTNLPR